MNWLFFYFIAASLTFNAANVRQKRFFGNLFGWNKDKPSNDLNKPNVGIGLGSTNVQSGQDLPNIGGGLGVPKAGGDLGLPKIDPFQGVASAFGNAFQGAFDIGGNIWNSVFGGKFTQSHIN